MATTANRFAPGTTCPTRWAVFAFDDLLEAKQWALDTQKGRRNLDKWELGKNCPEVEAGDRGQGKSEYVRRRWRPKKRGYKIGFDNVVKPDFCNQYS